MRGKNNFLLSIIIPLFNSERTIGRTLDSLNRMSRTSKEMTQVVVVDDGSEDGSVAIVEERIDKMFPLTVTVIRQDNKGSAGARNTGLEQTRGRWVFFLDADDEMAFDPIPYLQEEPEHSAIAFSVRWYKDSQPRRMLRPVPISTRTYLDVLTAANPFQPANFLIRRTCIATPFDTRFRYLEDWIFWFDNPAIFEDVRTFRNVISAYIHVHGGNKSASYEIVGAFRQKVAEEIGARYRDRLTKKQYNNIRIQGQIGRLLQGKAIEVKNFFFFPCSLKLYGKLMIYALFKSNFSKIDIYGT